MTKEEWIKIYTAKDGTWDKDYLIDKAYEIMTSPIRTNYDRIKQMSIEEMAAFIVKSKKIFVADAYKGISETLNKQKKFKGYSIEIDNSKVTDWEKEEFEIQKQWLLQEVEMFRGNLLKLNKKAYLVPQKCLV